MSEYLPDSWYEERYSGYRITESKAYSKRSGYLCLEKEIEGEDGEDTETKTDNFILHPDGKIAFDHWYPEEEYLKLSAIAIQVLASFVENTESTNV